MTEIIAKKYKERDNFYVTYQGRKRLAEFLRYDLDFPIAPLRVSIIGGPDRNVYAPPVAGELWRISGWSLTRYFQESGVKVITDSGWELEESFELVPDDIDADGWAELPMKRREHTRNYRFNLHTGRLYGGQLKLLLIHRA